MSIPRALSTGLAMVLACGVPAVAQTPVPSRNAEPGMCIEVQAGSIPAASWTDIVGAVADTALERPLFFPDAVVESLPVADAAWDPRSHPTTRIGVWPTASTEPLAADMRRDALAEQTCLRTDDAWAMTVSRDLLLAGSWRVVDSAGLDPGLRATIELELEFRPAEELVRTVLRFAVAGGFSRGTCWVDDRLAIDEATGRATSSDRVFADLQFGIPGDACDRFRAFMPEGGAGAQAIALLPVDITLSDGSIVRFVTTSIDVQEADIVLAGRIERG